MDYKRHRKVKRNNAHMLWAIHPDRCILQHYGDTSYEPPARDRCFEGHMGLRNRQKHVNERIIDLFAFICIPFFLLLMFFSHYIGSVFGGVYLLKVFNHYG